MDAANDHHGEIKQTVRALVESGKTDDEIARELNLESGASFKRGTVKWYKFCNAAKNIQKKAFEKYGFALYSNAGKSAQKKHPWIGRELGKKYGSICGKKRMEQLRRQGLLKKYFSDMANRLQEVNPEQSRRNMEKTIAKMKAEGTFLQNSMKGAKKCLELHPNHFSEMGKKAHKLHPELAYTSRLIRRENSPYFFMGCKFDSNQEKEICKLLVERGLIDNPIEGENVHFKINGCDVDFFIQHKVFLEFHPPLTYGRNRGENETDYYLRRRKMLDKNGYKEHSLIVISNFKRAENKIEEISELL